MLNGKSCRIQSFRWGAPQTLEEHRPAQSKYYRLREQDGLIPNRPEIPETRRRDGIFRLS